MPRPKWSQYIGAELPLSTLIYSLHHHRASRSFRSALHFTFSSELFSPFLSLIYFLSHRSIQFFRLDLSSSRAHHEILLSNSRLLCPGGNYERAHYDLA